MQLNSSTVFARYHESILDMEKAIRKVQLRRLVTGLRTATVRLKEEITLIQEEITNYRVKTRQLDSY